MSRISEAAQDFQTAVEVFQQVTALFCEPPTVEPSTFFAFFIRLGESFKVGLRLSRSILAPVLPLTGPCAKSFVSCRTPSRRSARPRGAAALELPRRLANGLSSRNSSSNIMARHTCSSPAPFLPSLLPLVHIQEPKAKQRLRLRSRMVRASVSATDGPEAQTEIQDGLIDELMSQISTTAFRRPEGQMKRDRRESTVVRDNAYASARPWLK